MEKYDGFKDWENVAQEYSGVYDWSDANEKANALNNIPKPEEVIFAVYYQGGYEGDSWVVYRNGNKYYTNEGSHCSCMGLEGQWNPEEYESPQLLLAALSKGDWSHDYGAKKGLVPLLKYILEERVTATKGSSDNE